MNPILAARSDFSIGESILTIGKLVSGAKAIGAGVVGLTDTMSVTALIDFSNAAKKAGLRPIIGCRLRLTDDATWRPAKGEKKKHMPREYFLTVYPRNDTGVKIVFRLLTLASSEQRFYYVPKLSFDDFFAELTDDLVVVLGDGASVLEHPDIENIAKRCRKQSEHVYAPLVPINTPYWGRVNQIATGLCATTRVLPLVIRPALYTEDGADVQEIMTAISDNDKITDGWFKSRYNRDMHLMGLSEMVGHVKTSAAHLEARGVTGAGQLWRDGLTNTKAIVDSISYVWEKAAVTLPKMAPDEFAKLTAECQKGWRLRFSAPVFGHQPTVEDQKNLYLSRLKYELEILKKLNFSGYFLLVQDIVVHAKTSGILVGPGRGSVGGSLVAYLMGITECDPIRFGLLFERFINPERLDLPDADLDFMSSRRHEIVDYLVQKFGRSRVAGVSNFGTLGAASAIRDVGRVTGLSDREYSVSKFVPKKHGANVSLPECREVGEIDKFANTYPEHWKIMEALEGTIRNFSQHAAGIVVGGCDLVERAVIEDRKGSPVVCFDKRMVEDQGLVKVDVLGLSTLDLIKLCVDYITERTGTTPDISAIPLDDPNVLKNFAEGRTNAIFQFESGGMRKLLKDLGADGGITFEDITACTALYRPGPMESGMMDSFAKRKQGLESVEYDHPIMIPVLEETFGVIVYQEQVMKISQVIAGYTGAGADKLRKIMGKKLPEEMKKERGNFVDGCVATIQCAPEWAGKLFDKIEGFAGYGFNKSHSVEYTLISYQAMWLKTNFPVEFFAAALTILDSDKLPGIIREAKSCGVNVDVPDINHSTGRFEIATDTRLVMPFQRIKGISDKTCDAILKARVTGRFTSMDDFLARVEKRSCNVRHREVLTLVGAFAWVDPTQQPPNHPSRIKDQIELLPGLIAAHVPINHSMNNDKTTKEYLGELIDRYRANHGPASATPDGMPVKPSFGRNARFMIIADCPNGQEDTAGLMGLSLSAGAITEAIYESGLDVPDAYWTALVKRPKRGAQLLPEEINLYKPYLDEEIEMLRPPVIVLMGTTTVRTFMPEFRGKASDAAGTVVYNRDLDANLVIGFNPGEIYHAPEKQENMNRIFHKVAELLA